MFDLIKYKFKLSDLVLILPVILLILSGDGKLSMSLATNRITNFNIENKNISENKDDEEEPTKEIIEEEVSIDFSNPDFEIIDKNYYELSNYITFLIDPDKYVGKTIRVRGFTNKMDQYVSDNYFGLGKYGISCCAADASFIGFIVRYDNHKVKNNAWYEVEGVLEKVKDKANYDILAIRIINIKEISAKEEEQYVYACYVYDDGSCKDVTKYNLEVTR